MPAYLIAFAKTKNANRIAEYSSAAGSTVVAAGGSIITRGKVRKIFRLVQSAQLGGSELKVKVKLDYRIPAVLERSSRCRCDDEESSGGSSLLGRRRNPRPSPTPH